MYSKGEGESKGDCNKFHSPVIVSGLLCLEVARTRPYLFVIFTFHNICNQASMSESQLLGGAKFKTD